MHKQPLLITGDSAGAGNTELLLAEGKRGVGLLPPGGIYGKTSSNVGVELLGDEGACRRERRGQQPGGEDRRRASKRQGTHVEA